MPRFRIFNTITDKVKKASATALKNAGQSSIDWFKSRVTNAFGKSRTRTAGAFNKRELELQQKAAENELAKKPSPKGKPTSQPNRNVDGRSKVGKNLQKNTSFDATFKKNLRNVGRPQIGRMYFYIYDPKWKKVLPYYDVFPLTIPIDYYSDGFLGLNLHYLPPLLRAKLLDYLFSLSVSTVVNGNEEKYMQVSYGILKAVANSKPFEPCLKRYLYSHVKSPFAQVLSEEWENAAFLNVAQFRKATFREVWVDSRARV